MECPLSNDFASTDDLIRRGPELYSQVLGNVSDSPIKLFHNLQSEDSQVHMEELVKQLVNDINSITGEIA